MIEALSAGIAAASVALSAYAVWTMSRTIARVLNMLSLERKEAREEAAALANRLVHPSVYQPTPAQREEGQQMRERASVPDPFAEEFEAAGTIDTNALFVGEEEPAA